MYVVTVGIGAAAAFVMSFVSSVGFDGFFGFGFVALLWAWTAWRGYRSIRTGDIASHQAWMIRNFARTYAGVTLRLWLRILIGIQLLFVNGPIDFEHADSTASIVLPFLSWLPNLLVAERLIRRRRLPTLVLSVPTTPPTIEPTAAV